MRTDKSREVSAMVIQYQKSRGLKKRYWFNKIYENFYFFITSTIFSMINKYNIRFNRFDIEEIVQDVVLLLKKPLDDYHGGYAFSSYAVSYIELAVRNYYFNNKLIKPKHPVINGKRSVVQHEIFSLDSDVDHGNRKGKYLDYFPSKDIIKIEFNLYHKIKTLLSDKQLKSVKAHQDCLIYKIKVKDHPVSKDRAHQFSYLKIRDNFNNLQRPKPLITPLARRVLAGYIKGSLT